MTVDKWYSSFNLPYARQLGTATQARHAKELDTHSSCARTTQECFAWVWLGQCYEILIVRDEWGELRAQKSTLISSDFKQVVVSDPAADGLSGPGWTLALKPSFKLSEKDGVFTLAGAQ